MSKKAARESAAARAAAVRRRQEAAERRRNLYVVGTVVAVILAVVGVGLLVQSNRDTTGDDATAPGGTRTTGTDAPLTNDDYGVVLGEAGAPTTITIYEDFQCPICAAFEAETAEKVRTAVEEGKVRVEYRIVSFLDGASQNDYSSRAANAAMVVLDAAGPEAFWTFHDLLFAQQPEEGTAGPSNDDLVELAVQAGASKAEVEEGIDDGAFDQFIVNATEAMSKNGVTGTPTALIDGEVVGETPAEAVEAVLAAVS